MKYKNVIIIGTSHIAKQSLKEVRNTIKEEKPDIIALELDAKRLYAMMNKKKEKINFYNIFRVGINGFIFSLIGAWVEKKLGEVVGVAPGEEMKTAIRFAKKNKIQIKLIDQDIEVTLKKLSQAITFKDKWHFVIDIVKAVVFRKKEVDFDLTSVPNEDIIETLIGKVKDRYPSVYKVLIEERNNVMSYSLIKLMDGHPDKKIVAIVGAGHKKAIYEMISDSNITYNFKVNV